MTTMTAINFQPVFDYIDQAKVDILTETKELIRTELRGVRADIANVVGDVSASKKEMIISNYRTSRLEEWAAPVGKKVKIPLEL